MRYKYVLVAAVISAWGQMAVADVTPGFHEGIADCIATIADLDTPFPQASTVEGNASDGFVAWYNNADDEPIYAVRLGVSGAGADTVISCQGPGPMGPVMDDFLQFDKPVLDARAGDTGLEILPVPADGIYYANSAADTLDLLIAVTYDQTNRTAIQVVQSAGVVQTCARFMP